MKNNTPVNEALVAVTPDLQLVSLMEGSGLSAQLTPHTALELARELVYKVALTRPAFGTSKDGETQDALSQAFAWIDNARAALAAVRAVPTSDKVN